MKTHHFALFMITIFLSACTWVEPTKGSTEVLLVKAGNVSNCNKLGTTRASVTHKIGVLTRDEESVREDLVAIAKNSAVKLGGDSIVARDPIVDGNLDFDVYKCNW